MVWYLLLAVVIGYITAVADTCIQKEGDFCLTGTSTNYQVIAGHADQGCRMYASYKYGMSTTDGSQPAMTDKLWIWADGTWTGTDDEMAYCAGYLEGWVASCAMANSYENVKEGFYNPMDPTDRSFDPKLVDYSKKQLDYIEAMYAKYVERAKTPEYASDPMIVWWTQAHLMIEQLKGLTDGFTATGEIVIDVNDPDEEQSFLMPFYYLNMSGEYDDLPGFFYPALQASPNFNHDINEHCTASVIFLKNPEDSTHPEIYFSQDSWSGYNTLYRIMKSYDLPYKNVKANHIVFSSYPIQLFSMDDLYVLSSGLAVYETTFHTWTLDLYQKYLRPETVPTWIRVQIANRLAKDGQSWARIFRKSNSGTYNNQYVIVDYNRFEKYLGEYTADPIGSKLHKNTAYVIEMGPGITFEYDATKDLENINLGYIPGINTPRPKLMFSYQGYPTKQSDPVQGYWGYETGARHALFEKHVGGLNNPGRQQPAMVKDYASFQKFKRYNNYLVEEIANKQSCICPSNPAPGEVCPCHMYREPSFAILSRYDLRTRGNGHDPSAFGGLDAKTTKYDLVKKMTFSIKPCPHDGGDNINEGNALGTPGYMAAWNFGNWNGARVQTEGVAPVNSHGLFQENYECSWTEMDGHLHGKTN